MSVCVDVRWIKTIDFSKALRASDPHRPSSLLPPRYQPSFLNTLLQRRADLVSETLRVDRERGVCVCVCVRVCV